MEGMASSSVMNSSNSTASCQSRSMKAAKPQEQLNCPRCNSTNTKFCYYNNYSLSQPRYFCKTCRRYWTEGGSLRNVPVGGGSRKNKRSSSLSSSSSSIAAAATATAASASSFKLPDLNPPSLSQFSSIQNPNKAQIVNDHTSSRDLNLSFPGLQDSNQAMDFLTSNGIASRGWIGSFIPTLMPADSNAVLYSSSGLPEFKPASNLSFSIDHGLQDNNNNNGAKILFPFGDIKHDHHRDQFPSSNNPNNVHDHQNHEGTTATSSSGNYWNAILDHGGSW